MSNRFGDLIKENPEKQTIYDIKKGEEKMTKEKIKRSELAKAATELNKVLGLDPEINEKGLTEELTEKLTEAIGLIDLEQDEVTEETMSTLEKLGFNQKPKETEPEEEEKEEAEDISEELEKEEPEEKPESEENEMSLIDQVQVTTKLADLKKLVFENEELKSLQRGIQQYKGLSGPRELKKKMLKKLGVDRPIQKKEKVKQQKRVKEVKSTEIGIGAFIRSILNTKEGWDKTNKEITEEVINNFPEANTKPHNISWYRNKIKNSK